MLTGSASLRGSSNPGPGRMSVVAAGTSVPHCEQLVIGLIVAGVGTGLLNATLGGEAVASLPPTKAGAGSGINNASRYIGAAFGVTVVTVLAVHPGGDAVRSLVAGWNVAVVVGIVVTVVGAVAVLLLHRVDKRRGR